MSNTYTSKVAELIIHKNASPEARAALAEVERLLADINNRYPVVEVEEEGTGTSSPQPIWLA